MGRIDERNGNKSGLLPGEILKKFPELANKGITATFIGLCLKNGALRRAGKSEKGRDLVDLISLGEMIQIINGNLDQMKIDYDSYMSNL